MWNSSTRRLMAGAFISQTGTWCASTAAGWIVLQATRDPFAFGLFIAATFLPSTLLSPVIGNLVDRWDQRRLTVIGAIGQALFAVLSFFFAATPASLFYPGLLVATSCGTAFSVLEFTARSAFLSDVVADDDRARFSGATATVSNVGRFVGPALATLIISVTAPGVCFLLDALTFAVAIVLLPRPETKLRLAKTRSTLGEGLRYVSRTPAVRDTLILFSLVSLVSMNVSTLVPLLVAAEFGNSPIALGILNSAFAAGALIGGLGRTVSKRSPEATLGIGLAVFGGTLCAIAVIADLAVATAIILASGAGRLLFTSSSGAVLMTRADRSKRGLVSGLYALAFNGTTPLGALLIVGMTQTTSIGVAFLISGTVALAAGLYHVYAQRRSAEVA